MGSKKVVIFDPFFDPFLTVPNGGYPLCRLKWPILAKRGQKRDPILGQKWAKNGSFLPLKSGFLVKFLKPKCNR